MLIVLFHFHKTLGRRQLTRDFFVCLFVCLFIIGTKAMINKTLSRTYFNNRPRSSQNLIALRTSATDRT